MTTVEVVDILRDSIYTLIIVSAPPMMVALVVGLIISLMQALTQIQEATLTFVPKILALLLTLIIAMPFMLDSLVNYGQELYARIETIE